YVCLVIPDRRDAGRGGIADGMALPQRLGPAQVRVLVLHHQPDGERVVGVAALGGHGVGWTGPIVRRDGEEWTGKAGERDAVPVDMKLVGGYGVREVEDGGEVIGRAGGRRSGLEPGIAGKQGEFRSRRVE